MASYKRITFSEVHRNMPFEDFKKLFASNDCFLEVPRTKREAELKKVWNKIRPKSANVSKSLSKRKKSNSSES